jgi:NAD(P)-dependent dehydrogenase (short-subunit alcohol dehydrogenase family)
MPRLTDQVAIVTGAASGIGRALAEQLARDGAHVVAVDLREPGLLTLAERVRAQRGAITTQVLDIADVDALAQLVTQTAATHGRLDFLFNIAGILVMGEVKDLSPAQWDRVIDVNLRATIHGTLAAYAVMRQQGFGAIANMSSMAGCVPYPFIGPYVTTKYAVFGMTVGLHAEAALYGVKVSVLCPGPVRTSIYSQALVNLPAGQALDAKYGGLVGMSPERCADQILEGVLAGAPVLHIGWIGWLPTLLYRWFPGLIHLASRWGMRLASRVLGSPAA